MIQQVLRVALLVLALGSAPGALAAQAPAVPAPTWADAEVTRLLGEIPSPRGPAGDLAVVTALESLIDQAADLPALDRALVRILRTRGLHGEVRAQARKARVRLALRRGRLPQAATARWRLGLVGDGLLLGPFDPAGGLTFAAEHPVEAAERRGEAPDPEARFPGGDRPLGWQRLPVADPTGRIDLGSLSDPAPDGVVFFRTVIHARRAGPAWLRLGTPGRARVILGGRVVHEDAATHPLRFDQLAVPVTLRRGANPLLIKVAVDPGDPGLWVRVTDRDGDRRRRFRQGRDPWASAPPARPGGRLRGADTVLARAAARARARARDPQALADHARVLSIRHPYPPAERRALEVAREAARRAGRSPRFPDVYRLLAALESDENRRLAALEAAVAADPRDVEALVALGQAAQGRRRLPEAQALLSRAVAAAPDHLGAAVGLAEVAGELGFPEDRRRGLEALVARHPLAPDALQAAATLAREAGRLDRVVDHLRVAASLFPGDPGFRQSLVSALLQQGALDEALERLGHAEVYDPGSVWPRLRSAELLAANGRPADALTAIAEAARVAPHDPRVPLTRARVHLARGAEAEAEAAVLEAQALSPQDAEVASLRRLLGERTSGFAELRRELEALVEAAPEAPGGAEVHTLAEVTLVRVHPNGLSSRTHQEVHRVLTPAGARRLRQLSVDFTPGEQDLEILEARVRHPDGTTVPALDERDQSLSEPWYRLYYDRQARVVTFPELAPGDVVELVWRRDDVAAENLFGDYFGDFVYLQGRDPVAEHTYVLQTPAGMEIHANAPALPGLEHTEGPGPDGGRTRRWTARAIPGVAPEPGMPGWSEVAATLHLSTFAEWDEVARWWADLIEDQLVPSGELEALARRLVAGIPRRDLRARVAAIHRYVVTQTRYVGLEFGIHGFKPYRVDQIHERRFGDCKDKASLMYALMEAVGIDARLVLLRMRRLGRLEPTPASLAVFNHAILYQPDLDLWLDGTAEYAGTGELPSQDRGAAALVIDPERPSGARFLHVPWPEAGANTSDTRVTFTLSPDGSARGEGRLTVQGTAAPAYRQGYQAEEERRQRFEASWADTWAGAAVPEVRFSGLDDLEAPVVADFELAVPHLARGEGEDLRLSLLGSSPGYVKRYAPLSTRSHDLVLGYPFVSRFEYAVRLPPGFAPAALPAPVSMETEVGSLTVRWTKQGDTLTVAGALTLPQARIPPERYPAFRALLARADKAMSQPVRLSPASPLARDDHR